MGKSRAGRSLHRFQYLDVLQMDRPQTVDDARERMLGKGEPQLFRMHAELDREIERSGAGRVGVVPLDEVGVHAEQEEWEHADDENLSELFLSESGRRWEESRCDGMVFSVVHLGGL